MFKHAHRWGYVKTNQAEHVDRPRIEKKEIEILEPEQIKKLLGHATDAYRMAFKMAVMTGMRAGELWGLQWGMLIGTPLRYMSVDHYGVVIFKTLNPKHPFERLIYPKDSHLN